MHSLINIGTETIFLGQTGAYSSFSFSQNYHLKSPSAFPGYSNQGVGVYGGTAPLKVASVPQNPHIINKTIATSINSSGKLNVNIKVIAQTK